MLSLDAPRKFTDLIMPPLLIKIMSYLTIDDIHNCELVDWSAKDFIDSNRWALPKRTITLYAMARMQKVSRNFLDIFDRLLVETRTHRWTDVREVVKNLRVAV